MPLSRLRLSIPVVIILAAALRLINLANRPLWYDEAFSILYSQNSLETVWQGILTQLNGSTVDVHPPLFYSLLHVWMSVIGQSPAAVRLLSVLLSILTVTIIFLLGRYMFGTRTGVIAALIAAIAPFTIYYAQEARMYALLGFAATTTVYFFVRAWSESRRYLWFLFALFGALTLYSHNLGAVFILALDLWVLWSWRHLTFAKLRSSERFSGVLLSHFLMLLLSLPWLLILVSQVGRIQQFYWVTKPGLTELLQTLLVFHFAYDNQALPGWLVPPAILFALFIPIIVSVELIRRRPSAPPASAFPEGLTLLLFLAVGPVLLTFVISQFRPVYVIRAMLPAALMYYLVVAYVMQAGNIPRLIKSLVVLSCLAIIGLSLANHYIYSGFPRAPYPDVTSYLKSKQGISTPVIHSNKLSFLPSYYYAPDLSQQFIADSPDSPSDTLYENTQAVLGVSETASLETATSGSEQVHFVVFENAIAEFEAAGKPHPHLAWLQEHYMLVDMHRFGDLRVYEFSH